MNGFGVEKNTGKALQLYQAAAAKGSPLAHYNLAVLHSEGRGVPRDEEQALALARNATRLGFVKAHNIIDTIYRSGRGAREPDRENAVKWNKAGDEYFLGRGVTKNLDEAEKLFRQAAATGFLRAKAGLAVVLGKKTKPTAQNKEEALRLLRDSAGGGDPDAQLLLANAILDQYAGGAADKEAVQWLLKAVEQGHSNAANKLAVLHWNSGRGLDKKDPIEGFRLCAISAVAGVEDSKKGVENFMHGFISNGTDPAPLKKILAEVKAANPDLAPLEEIGK